MSSAFRRLIATVAAAFLLLAGGSLVFAQDNFAPSQWIGDSLLLQTRLNGKAFFIIDEHNAIKTEIPRVSSLTDFDLSQELRRRHDPRIFWRDDALYSSVFGADEKNNDGTQFTRFSVVRWQDDEWSYIGSYKCYLPMALLFLIPCDNDRFIAVTTADLANNAGTDRTPFARMALNPETKDIRLVASIDHGHDELRGYMASAPSFSSREEFRENVLKKGQDAYDKYLSAEKCFSLAWYSQVILTDGHATLLNLDTGLYWVFSLENARLVKTGNIFRKATPEWMAKGGFTNAVLNAHPEKDGTVLISAIQEEMLMKAVDPTKEANKEIRQDNVAVAALISAIQEEMSMKAVDPNKESNKEFRQNNVAKPDATMMLKNPAEVLFNYIKQSAQDNWAIVWYRLYPENGKVEKLVAPPLGGALDREGGRNDRWRPMPDGSVKMGAIRLTGTENKTKKDEPAEGKEKRLTPKS